MGPFDDYIYSVLAKQDAHLRLDPSKLEDELGEIEMLLKSLQPMSTNESIQDGEELAGTDIYILFEAIKDAGFPSRI